MKEEREKQEREGGGRFGFGKVERGWVKNRKGFPIFFSIKADVVR